MASNGLEVMWKRLNAAVRANFPALTALRASRLVSKFPEFGPAWTFLGIALVELARYEEAEEALVKGLRLCPAKKRRIPLSELGHLNLGRGDYGRAARWYRKAINADKDNAAGYIYLGTVLAKQGRLTQAEKALRAATRCSAGCLDEAFLNLGLVLRAQERFAEAAECFRKAIALDSRYREARKALRDVESCVRAIDAEP